MSVRGYREFYLRPTFIMKRMANTSSLKNDLKNFKIFLKQFVVGKG
jgi:hypothetical protein